MGDVVQLSDYRKQSAVAPSKTAIEDSLVPIEFAVGLSDRTACLQILAEYGIHNIQIRRVNEEPDALLYLMGVKDAIQLNKEILAKEDLSDDEILSHIDVIQMLENLDLSIMESLWASFTRGSSKA